MPAAFGNFRKRVVMKFNDLKVEAQYFAQAITRQWKQVSDSGMFLFGPQGQLLEKNMAQLSNRKYAVAVKNATEAITFLIRKLSGKSTPIILPDFGAYPTAMAALAAQNSNLHFVPVDSTYTMNVATLPDHLKRGIVIAVHLFGNNCDMSKIIPYASQHDHIIIEDCAQSTGSDTPTNQNTIKVYSFYPTKPLASMGDGGMICTNDKRIYDWIKEYRFYGLRDDGMIERAGVNSRMDEWQAAVVNAKFKDFDDLNQKRIVVANQYKKIVRGITTRGRCIYHQFPMRFLKRDQLIVPELIKRDIPYIIHYPYHVSDHPVFNYLKYQTPFRINHQIISLPCHPFMEQHEIDKVIEFLADFKKWEVGAGA